MKEKEKQTCSNTQSCADTVLGKSGRLLEAERVFPHCLKIWIGAFALSGCGTWNTVGTNKSWPERMKQYRLFSPASSMLWCGKCFEEMLSSLILFAELLAC